MINKIFKKVFGTRNDRLVGQYRKTAQTITALESSIEPLSDDALKAKTESFRDRINKGESLDDLLSEAFAVVREASKRTLGLRHFDVQLIGGMVLHHGKIAEMRMGEGKTLMATLACYLNALSGEGVHVVTVNDYLAERDANWMRPVYEFLGLTVGINLTGMEHEAKQQAYAADITYGTNNEFGFDYLRDNMVFDLSQRVQKKLNFCVIDEVDSILIDEARTPLIISGQAEESSDLYAKINKVIPLLTRCEKEDSPGDYVVDEKNRQAHFTEEGHEHVEKILVEKGLLKEGDSLYGLNNISIMHYLSACLRAHALFQRDVHYIVRDNEVIIVDEHTGRLMAGRRWSEGLHQAVEAKENAKIELENQTLATITFQNYFRLYEKLSGMTGTADTEAFEFQKIYELEVVVIPTNKPMVRIDSPDLVYMSNEEKYKSIIEDLQKRHEKGQPVLVGTASIESSELISAALQKAGVKHEVLNAKQHEREAKIIAEAGQPGSITIATNMAGRGTDIVLGGNFEVDLEALGESASDAEKEAVKKSWEEKHKAVLAAGGLHVLGTERNESRRIDNQLRGRSGRQGDAGSSEFYLSLDDNLLRIFAADRMGNLMRKLGVKKGDVIQHPWLSKAIENAQRKVEGMNFDIRKNLLEYDDVANDQRKVIYSQRFELMSMDSVSKVLDDMREDAITVMLDTHIPPNSLEDQWNVAELEKQIKDDFNLDAPVQKWLDGDDNLSDEDARQRITETIETAYKEKYERVGSEIMQQVEKNTLLQLLDQHWKDHLAAMDHLRQGIHLRGYAQQNPTQEYKRESFEMFKAMLNNLKYDLVSTLARVEVASEDELTEQRRLQERSQPTVTYQHQDLGQAAEAEEENPALAGLSDETPQPFTRNDDKVGRNDPCPCGSGKKYKQCHGKL